MITGPPDDYTNHLKTAAHEALSMTDIIERLRSKSPYLDGSSAERTMAEAAAEIDRLTAERDERTAKIAHLLIEIERCLTPEQAYLQIVEGWLRDNRDIHFPEGAVDDLCKRIARRALEPKP